MPDWYDDAKVGIALHWGPFSVPGWAPRGPSLDALWREGGSARLLRENPRAEWYGNSMQIRGGPTQLHHVGTYGDDYPYDNFVRTFNEAAAGADLDALAGLCRSAGARYVLLSAKHHDGFALWPSRTAHPVKGPYHARRDLVGELTEAVRDRRMRMGLLYSGGYDWPYSGRVLTTAADTVLAVPHDRAYVRYATAHWRELIDRYQPSVMWNDVAWPRDPHLAELLAHFYNTVDEGVVNDRWRQRLPRHALSNALIRAGAGLAEAARRRRPGGRPIGAAPVPRHCDFRTLAAPDDALAASGKWELTRPLGHSSGANRNERPEDVISDTELIRTLCDVVARNGNLVVSVGPRPDGTVAEEHLTVLRSLGSWLADNGEAIYGSRPWVVTESVTAEGTRVRFTKSGEGVYALAMGMPGSRRITLRGVDGTRTRRVRLVGTRAQLAWSTDPNGDLTVTLPEQLPLAAVTVLDLGPEVRARLRGVT